MPRFAANLTTLFTEVPFLERFQRAAAAGFDAVECLFPYEYPSKEVAARLERHGLTMALINMPAGDWEAGDRGTAALPHRRQEFRAALARALTYASALHCRRIHVMSGIIPPEAEGARCREAFVENLRHAADRASQEEITLTVEALNSRDVPGYFVAHQEDVLELVRLVDRPNVAVQLDYYHAQIMDGDLTRLTERLIGRIGHVQIASVPDRHEPYDGEINYRHIFDVLDGLGYDGWIGCEYTPRGSTEAGLGWRAALR